MTVEIQSKEERQEVIERMANYLHMDKNKLKKKNSTQLLAQLHKAHLHPNNIREDMDLDTYEKDGQIHLLLDEYIGFCTGWTKKERQEMKQEPKVAPDPKNKSKKQSGNKQKKEKQPSAYGTAVEIMCEDPNMDKTRLFTSMTAKGFDTENSKGPINTAFLQFRKVYGLLKEHDHIT